MLRKMCVNSFIVRNRICFEPTKWCVPNDFVHNLTKITEFSFQLSRCSYFSTKAEDTKLTIKRRKRKSSELATNYSEFDDKLTQTEYKRFEQIFQCSATEAVEAHTLLCEQNNSTNLKTIEKTVKWLHRLGATHPVLLKNCHILLIFKAELKRRYERLKRGQWKQVDDFVPFLDVRENAIKNIQMLYGNNAIPNRIYLLNAYFSIEPHIISYFCAKHLVTIEMNEELLKRKLELLLSNGVAGINILRDLHVVERSEISLIKRFELLKECKVERIMPWMLKCENETFYRSLEIRSMRPKNVNKILEIMSEKFNCHPEKSNTILMKNAFLYDVDPDKLSIVLDELLKIFTPNEILNNIKLLGSSVEHTEIRVAELLALKNTAIDNLTIDKRVFGMTKKAFERYLNTMKIKKSEDEKDEK